MCVYTYIHTYIYNIYTYVLYIHYKHTNIQTYIHTYIYIYMYIHTYVCVSYMHIIYIYTYIYICGCVYLYSYKPLNRGAKQSRASPSFSSTNPHLSSGPRKTWRTWLLHHWRMAQSNHTRSCPNRVLHMVLGQNTGTLMNTKIVNGCSVQKT